MLDAALTSLRFGFEHFLNSYEDPERLRQAVIDIHVGIELLLKERLARENPLFVIDKIDEKSAIEAHLTRNHPPQSVRAGQRTVGFEGALSRLERLGLLPRTADRTRLTRLNQLRNELVHAGSSAQLDEGLQLIAADAVKFVNDFLREQLGTASEKVFGTGPWTSVRALSMKVSDERERAFQKKLGQHRARVATLSPDDVTERMRTTIDLGTDETRTMQCPACDHEAYVGVHIEGPDDFDDGIPLGGGAYVEEIQCQVCELRLEGVDLDRFQHLADELLAAQYEEYR